MLLGGICRLLFGRDKATAADRMLGAATSLPPCRHKASLVATVDLFGGMCFGWGSTTLPKTFIRPLFLSCGFGYQLDFILIRRPSVHSWLALTEPYFFLAEMEFSSAKNAPSVICTATTRYRCGRGSKPATVGRSCSWGVFVDFVWEG